MVLDLSPYAYRLRQKGWNESRVQSAFDDYREFLLESKQDYGDPRPSKDVDEVWHLHILDTQKYHEDCMNMLGFFLHHVPDEATCRRKTTATCRRKVNGRAALV